MTQRVIFAQMREWRDDTELDALTERVHRRSRELVHEMVSGAIKSKLGALELAVEEAKQDDTLAETLVSWKLYDASGRLLCTSPWLPSEQRAISDFQLATGATLRGHRHEAWRDLADGSSWDFTIEGLS